MLFVVANGKAGFSAKESGFATNGYGDRSPEGYSLLAVLVVEVVLTAVFLFVILGATDTRAPKGFAPIAIGLSLTLIHLASIPVSNTSVNPARSTGPALFAGGDALVQLWVFWARTAGRRGDRRRDVRAAVRQGRDRRAAARGDRGLTKTPAESARTHASTRSSRHERTSRPRRVGANARQDPAESAPKQASPQGWPPRITCVRADSAPR